MTFPRQFDAHTIRRIAVEADRDPRSVIAVLQGRARGTTASSVRKAITRLGLESTPAPEPPQAA